MSESPGPAGDAANLIDGKRQAEGDEEVDAVPSKYIKLDEKADVDEDVASLEDDEQDFEDEEDEDLEFGDDEDEIDEGEGDLGGPSEENILDETGESSTDMEEFLQTSLAYIEDCQADIDSLNQNANDEIIRVEQKYNKLREPVYSRRNKYIEQIPNFWANVFSRHPQLKRVLTDEDISCLRFLINLQIDDFEDGRSGYSIKFKFADNMWFTNKSITKEYHLPWHGSPSCECTRIEWKQGMDLTRKPSSFFSWFCSQDDASTDDIAEIIKEELWPNPLHCYLKENGEVGSSGESDGENEGPVYIDDEEAEYISSEGEEGSDREEEWRRPPALGKEAPGTSKQGDMYVVDEEDDEDVGDYGDDVVDDDDDDDEDDDDEIIETNDDDDGYNAASESKERLNDLDNFADVACKINDKLIPSGSDDSNSVVTNGISNKPEAIASTPPAGTAVKEELSLAQSNKSPTDAVKNDLTS